MFFRPVCPTCPGDRNGLKRKRLHYGMKRQQAEKAALEIGATVSPIRRTGETQYIFPSGRRLKTNARRKDAPKSLVKALLDEMGWVAP